MSARTLQAHKRLLTYCAEQTFPDRSHVVTAGNPAHLLRSLLLFDHVVLRSINFEEFPAFVSTLGVGAVIELFSSKVITVLPDFAYLGVPGKDGRNSLPSHHYGVSILNSFRADLLPKCFERVRNDVTASRADLTKLEYVLQDALAPEPEQFGKRAWKQTDDDLQANHPSLKTAIAAKLRRIHLLAIEPENFEFEIHREGKLYKAESNIGKLCNLTDSQVHSVVGDAITTVAMLNLRLEEMESQTAISGFEERDLEIFDSRIRFLVERQSPADQEQRFEKIISILDLPDVPAGGKTFDAAKFLELRSSENCQAFRAWLSETAAWSDEEIRDRVHSIRQTFARYYKSMVSSVIRFSISTGLGYIPGPLQFVGTGLSALDTFLFEKIIRPSGAIAFIASEYPQLFEK